MIWSGIWIILACTGRYQFIMVFKEYFVKRLFTLLLANCILISCSQFSNSPTSKAWHNLNAKYNSLLIARDNYKIAKTIDIKERKENFGTVLPIFHKIDSTKLKTARPHLEEVVKKTSLIAERHSNSKYIDEAYLLLGKARLMKGEIFNAIETFKYVNTTGKSQDKKNEALIWLMRAYTESGDFQTANQVSDILKSAVLSPRDKAQYLLVKAHFHQVQGEDALAVVLLEEALKNMPKSAEKARYHFIAGQLFDQLNRPVYARKNYQMAKKNRPDYDIEFYSNLGLMMNQSLANNTINTFEGMLTDRKNTDLKDKIYFKMGELESKKRNYDQAIEYYQKSVALSTDDNVQKAYSYKAIGDIYFNHLGDFEKSASYYDSTIITIPKDYPDYKTLILKTQSLNDFLKYKKTLDLEDSLQTLAAMNPLALDNKLEEIIIQQEKDKKKLSDAAKVVANQQNPPQMVASNGAKNRWILYDPAELLKSRNEFTRVWGNRNLDDNWRRADKETGSVSFSIERGVEKKDSLAARQTEEELDKANKAAESQLAFRKSELLQKIPKTPIQQAASKRKQEEAYYQLGKIYKLQFQDNEKARATFITLTEKFPKSIYAPEAYYFLAIMEENPADNVYRTTLLEKFPGSSFARQIKKGNVKISSDKETEAQNFYAAVFKSYSEGNYDKTLESLENGLNEYIGSQVEDKMAMLRIMILAKKQNKDQYQIALQDFLRSYPNSDLTLKAKDMLAVINK